jgi:hypothetical protein
MVKKGPRYTPKEAQARIPIVARQLALSAVDLVIALERHPIDSHEIESRVWEITGEAGFLGRLCHVIWRYEALTRYVTQGEE